MKVILCCDCGDTPAFAKDAYSILFPSGSEPAVYAGDDKIAEFSTTLPQQSEAYAIVSGLSQSKEKFAVFLDIDDDSSVANAYNLLTGNRMQ